MKRFYPLLILLAPFLLFLVTIGITHPAISDEHSYFVTSKIFGEKLPYLDLKNYYVDQPEFKEDPVAIVATPPLNVVMYGLFGKVVGYDQWKMRLIPLIFGIIAVLTFYTILRDLKISHPVPKVLLFLLYPYTLLLSFTAQTDIIALAYFLLSLRFFLRNKKYDLLWASLFGVLAAYTRQDYLFIAPALVTSYLLIKREELLAVLKRKKPFATKIKESMPYLGKVVLLSLPVLLVFPLFLYWGGLLPSSYLALENLHDEHTVTISVEKLTFFFIMVGIFFIPLVLDRGYGVTRRDLWAIPLAILLILFPLTNANCEGIICKAGSFIEPYTLFIYLVFLGIGVHLIVRQFSIRTNTTIILYNFIAWILLSTITTTVVRQRYYLMFIPLLIILLYEKYDNKMVLWGWTGISLLIAFGYSVFKIFIQGGAV